MTPARTLRYVSALAVLAGLVDTVAVAQRETAGPLHPPVGRYLKTVGFGDGDLSRLTAGVAIARLASASASDQVGAIGAVWIDAPAQRLLDRYRDITTVETGDGVLRTGAFSSPPQASDVERLALPPEDLADLPDCSPGDCKVNLSRDAIERLRSIDWSASSAVLHANQVAREMLVNYVSNYQQRGNDALMIYGHRAQPLPLETSLRLLEDSTPLLAELPELATYFERYPRQPLPAGAREFFYWSQVTFGLKPVTRVNHVVMSAVSAGGSGYAIASRTIYASHYFRDGLEIRFFASADGASGFYLVAVNRSHTDSLGGFRGRLIGARVRRSIRDGMERYLNYVKRVTERSQP